LNRSGLLIVIFILITQSAYADENNLFIKADILALENTCSCVKGYSTAIHLYQNTGAKIDQDVLLSSLISVCVSDDYIAFQHKVGKQVHGLKERSLEESKKIAEWSVVKLFNSEMGEETVGEKCR